MKKLIAILGVFTLPISASAAVIACQSVEDNSFSETTQLTNEQKNEMRNNFIADATRIIDNHITGNSGNLYVSKSRSNNERKYLKYDTLMQATTDLTTSSKSLTLTGSNFTNFKEDINQMLNIEGQLKSKLNSELFEKSDYSFLLVNIQNVLKNYVIDPNISITPTKFINGNTTETNFTVRINISFDFNYLWNNYVETESTKTREIKYIVLPEDQIVNSVSDIIENLADKIYNSSNLLRFSDQTLGLDLESTNNIFGKQENAVLDYFSQRKSILDSNLKQKISEILSNSSSATSSITLSYEKITTATIRRLYLGSLSQTIRTDGFWEAALFEKDKNLNEDQIDVLFEQEFATTYGRKNFVRSQSENIANTFHVKIDTNINPEFTEYGEIRLENPTLNIYGTEIEINSIPLLYSYKPETSFAKRAARVFAKWRSKWGVTASTDRWALFKLSVSTPNGKEFWQGNRPVYPFRFADWSNRDIISGSGIESFSINNNTGYRNPYPVMDTKGFSIDYTSYWNQGWSENNPQFLQSWTFVVNLGELSFSINFVNNKDYYKNFWVGSGDKNSETKYIIERGA